MTTCDRCPAIARGSAVVDGVTLNFCAHHFRNNEVGLIVAASYIDAGILDAERFIPKDADQ